MSVQLDVNGVAVTADPVHASLLELLREQLQLHSVKDGCAPQGQCGCCTVLVDGQPRVACVTPLRRVAGRSIVTVEGLDPEVRQAWLDAFAVCGASQCGFCSPGIMLRLVSEVAKARPQPEQALLAHLCRCTGWGPILAAFDQVRAPAVPPAGAEALARASSESPVSLRSRRASLEGHVAQSGDAEVALGRGGFAEDLAPPDALVAVRDGAHGWVVAETAAQARQRAGTVQGRRSTLDAPAAVALPPGRWDRVLQTSWVDPAYLETDASWCRPGGTPADPAGNGGDFGGKTDSPVAEAARRLAEQYQRPVRVRLSREDVIRLGAKRPPLAAGIDFTARRLVVHVARTAGVLDALRAGLGADHGFDVELHEVDVAGPRTSLGPRGAGWAEGVVLRAALRDELAPVHQPGGGWASAQVVTGADGRAVLEAEVAAGDPLAEAVLRSYCSGAMHMALSWVTSERITLDAHGEPLDLTLRSLGVLRAVDMPPVRLRLVPPLAGPPRAVSDALFAATAAAVWAHQGWAPAWPTGRALTS